MVRYDDVHPCLVVMVVYVQSYCVCCRFQESMKS